MSSQTRQKFQKANFADIDSAICAGSFGTCGYLYSQAAIGFFGPKIRNVPSRLLAGSIAAAIAVTTYTGVNKQIK